MFLTSDSTGLMNEPVFGRAQGDAWYVNVKSAKHLNYTDFSLFSPWFSRLGLLGPIDGQRMERITNAYILAFFDQQLADRNSPLLQGESADYPEVTVQKRTGVAAPALPGR
jgi:hypothetical protein